MNVQDLKKIWSFEKKKDNTYILKKYKGKESKVVVPGIIGKTIVSEIDSNCFPYNNDFIEELDIDENIEIINSIYGFRKLRKINFKKVPKQIKAIYALGDNIESFGIFGEKVYFNNRLIAVSSNIDENFVVEDGTIEISYSAFSNCKKIKSVILPESVKVIGEYSFASCSNLEKINLEKVEKIENSAFSCCDKLRIVNLNSIKELGSSAFKLCGINELNISGLEKIPREGFSNCSELEKIVIGEGTTTIERSAFEWCDNLIDITLPKTLKTIEDSAFIGCKKIEKINLSNEVETFTYSFESSIYDKIRPKTNENQDDNTSSYSIQELLNETKNMSKDEIEKFIRKLLTEHKLDHFDTSNITDMNNIGFNKDNGEITWKCPRCGYCTFYLWDLLADNGKMIDNFDISGCGICG